MSLRRERRRALAAAAFACGVSLPPAHALMAGAAPDTAAARVDANTPSSRWRGVVAVQTPAGVFSGVTVGRRHVLTAAHVLDGLPAAADVRIHFNVDSVPVELGAARYTRHPQYVGFGVPDLSNDLALIELAADRPSGSVSYGIDPATLAAGTVVSVAGYGASGQGDVGVTVGRSTTVKRVGRNVIDAVAIDGTGVARLFRWDFDGPTLATNFLGGPTLGNAVETTLAGGDSGAGVFREVAGQALLVGIGSFAGSFVGGPTGQGVFGTAAGGQLLAGYAPWINDVISASGFGEAEEDIPLPGWVTLALGAMLAYRALRRRDPANRRDATGRT